MKLFGTRFSVGNSSGSASRGFGSRILRNELPGNRKRGGQKFVVLGRGDGFDVIFPLAKKYGVLGLIRVIGQIERLNVGTPLLAVHRERLPQVGHVVHEELEPGIRIGFQGKPLAPHSDDVCPRVQLGFPINLVVEAIGSEHFGRAQWD